MTTLVACLGKNPGTVAHVSELIKKQDWDKIFIITEEQTSQKFEKHVEFILVNPKKMLPELAEGIRAELKPKINDIEVAVNVVSGSGKLHMATMSALLKMGLGIRLVSITPQGVQEL